VPCGRVPSVSCWVCSSLVAQGTCIDLPASHSAEVVTERTFSLRNVCYIHERSLPVSWISSRGQSTRGHPPACELGEGLTTRYENQHVTKCDTGPQTWMDSMELLNARKDEMGGASGTYRGEK